MQMKEKVIQAYLEKNHLAAPLKVLSVAELIEQLPRHGDIPKI